MLISVRLFLFPGLYKNETWFMISPYVNAYNKLENKLNMRPWKSNIFCIAELKGFNPR